MAIKHILDKTKDVMKVVKNKAVDVIEKGNSQLKKLSNTKNIYFINSPIIGGFETKKAFYEDGYVLFPTEEHDEKLFILNNIIKFEEDNNYYVIKEIILDPINKTIYKDDKEFNYECYKVYFARLDIEFENDIKDLRLHALNENQEQILSELVSKINEKKIVINGKKDVCLDLWSYFVKCIQYDIKKHYIVLVFSKVAEEIVEDFSSYLIKLF